MSRRQSDQTVYAAAEGREFLRGALEGKSNEFINEFAGLIDDAETLDLLNHYCSIWRDEGENFLDTRLAAVIIRSASTRMYDRAVREGNVSQMKSAVGLTSQEKDAEDVIGIIASRLADEGAVAVVVGPPGAGKTATTLDVARAWGVRTGGSIFGNTAWDGFDQRVTTDVELLEAMASVTGQTLGVVDESAQNLSGEGKDAKKGSKFVDRMTFIRKSEKAHGPHAKQGSLLVVGHTLPKLIADMRRLATLIIQKPSRADPGKVTLYESPGGEDKLEEIGTFHGLTDTRERYNEREPSPFDVVDVEDDEDDDQEDDQDVRRQEAIRTALKAVQPWDDDNGMFYDDAGQIVGYSESWVGDRVKEWKRGEHRDLVESPGGDSK